MMARASLLMCERRSHSFFLGGFFLVRCADSEHVAHRSYEITGGGRGVSFAVEGLRIFLVLVDVVAGEIEAGEEALAAGVGEELRVGQGGDGGLRVAANGTGGRRGVPAQ